MIGLVTLLAGVVLAYALGLESAGAEIEAHARQALGYILVVSTGTGLLIGHAGGWPVRRAVDRPPMLEGADVVPVSTRSIIVPEVRR